MKKLCALFLAMTLVAVSAVTVFAAKVETVSQFASFDTDASTDFYNPGNTVYVEFSVTDVVLDGVDGISALDLELHYDAALVEPGISPSYDEEGTYCDFTSVLVNNPDGVWDVFGTIDTEKSCYVLGFADWYVEAVITAETSFTVKVPFVVKSTTKVDDIVFSFENVMAYNSDLSKGCEIKVEDVVVRYALQPDSLASLPNGIVPIHIAGYKHDVNNVIYYTDTQITVADYVSSFMDPVSGQDMMKSFGIIVASRSGKVLYSDLTDSDKSEVVIPADSYIIGIYADNIASIPNAEWLSEKGAYVKLYNVNVEATGRVTEGTALNNAGFSLDEFKTEDGADAYIDYENKTVTVYVKNVTLSMLDDMIVGNISVIGKKGALSSNSIVSTGDVIDYADGYTVIILGDVNCDGKVNQFDCALLKAHVLKGNELTEAGYKAACVVSKKPSTFDYLAIKTYYFGKRDFVALNPDK